MREKLKKDKSQDDGIKLVSLDQFGRVDDKDEKKSKRVKEAKERKSKIVK